MTSLIGMTPFESMILWIIYSVESAAGLAGVAMFFAAPWIILAGVLVWNIFRKRGD
jgi:hypothetical protein